MSRDVVTTDRIAEPVGPFSLAVRAATFMYLSGQVAQDPATRTTRSTSMRHALTVRSP
jgi:enamine deaminase RidA (YjgF/YER057c/UK114 family)